MAADYPTPTPGSALVRDLSITDQAELIDRQLDIDNYNAAMAVCQQERQQLQAELNAINSDIKNTEKSIAATQKELKDVDKALKNKKIDPDKKEEFEQKKEDLNKNLSDEKAKLNEEQKNKKKHVNEYAIKKCKIPKPQYCVPADKNKKIPDPLASLASSINADKGTKINFSALTAQEGSYSGAYIPWSATDKNGNYITAQASNVVGDPPTLVVRGAKMNGNYNQSGVSIGTGIDLGQQDKNRFYKDLDMYNGKYNILTPSELNDLKEKIDPYMGLKRSAACQFLRRNSLDLNTDEIKLLNARASNVGINSILQKDPNFINLSPADQTVRFKSVYNTGGH